MMMLLLAPRASQPTEAAPLGAPPASEAQKELKAGEGVADPVLKRLRRRCHRHRSRSTPGTVWDGDGASRPLRPGVLACGAVDRLAAQRLAAFGRVDAAVA